METQTKHISQQFNEEMENLRNQVLKMGGLVEQQIGNATNALRKLDVPKAEKVIKNKVGLIKLAEHLGNVSEACKIMGFSRDSFYRFKDPQFLLWRDLPGLLQPDHHQAPRPRLGADEPGGRHGDQGLADEQRGQQRQADGDAQLLEVQVHLVRAREDDRRAVRKPADDARDLAVARLAD